MTLPELYKINDSRNVKDFSKNTFSGYLKTEVNSALQKNLIDGKIEESCNWCVELLLSLQDSQIFDKLIIMCCKIININNPKLPLILSDRFENYINLVKNKYQNNLKEIRNDQQIRNHIAEICCIICRSNKGKAIGIKKPKDNDFKLEVFKNKLKGKQDTYISNISRPGDPNELCIVVNEFYHELLDKNFTNCTYWLGWVYEWEKKMIKKEGSYSCGYRPLKNIDNKYHTDFIWFFWEVLLKEGMKINNDLFNIQIQSLYKLFKFEYTNTKKTKRVCFLLNAIKYFTDYYDINSPIIIEYNIILQAVGNINYMYNLRKQFEINNNKQLQSKLKKMNDLSNDKRNNDKRNNDKRNNDKRNNDKINNDKRNNDKKHNIKISEDSFNKLDLLNKIDNFRLNK